MTATYELSGLSGTPQRLIKDDALVAGNFRRASEEDDVLAAAETLAYTLDAVRKRNEGCGIGQDPTAILNDPPEDNPKSRMVYRIAAEYLLIMAENTAATAGPEV